MQFWSFLWLHTNQFVWRI